MTHPFEGAPAPIRTDLFEALGRAWAQLAAPGAWLDGEQRVAVATAARKAWNCALCDERKEALSPYTIAGEHESTPPLPQAWLEVIHPVVRDSGRLTERWYRSAREAGIGEDAFVEMVSVAIITTTIDAYALGIGMTPPPLPQPVAGTPHRIRAPQATMGPGWVSTIAPEDAGPDFEDFYANESHFYIRRSLTLVPDEVRRFWDLMNPLYMEDPRLNEIDGLDRGISRAQIEFLAARCSALLGCLY